MSGPDGLGEDIEAAIREFGPKGQISQVHLRNTTSPMPNFQETFPDDGYLDLFRIVCTLCEVGFAGMLMSDHVPDYSDGRGSGSKGEVYALGYIRGLIQASETASRSLHGPLTQLIATSTECVLQGRASDEEIGPGSNGIRCPTQNLFAVGHYRAQLFDSRIPIMYVLILGTIAALKQPQSRIPSPA